MFGGHWFAAEFGFFGSVTKRQETEVIAWVRHSQCFRSFSPACSVWRRVGSDFFLVALQVNSSETLGCSAGGSANVLKFVNILALDFGVLSCVSSHTTGFLESNMVTWVLVPLRLKPSTQYLKKSPTFPSWGKFPFVLLDAELAGGVYRFVLTVFHYFPNHSLSVSWAPAQTLNLLVARSVQFQQQRSSPDVLVLRGFAHTRDVQAPISYLWNSLWHRGVLLLLSSLPKGDCQQ